LSDYWGRLQTEELGPERNEERSSYDEQNDGG
jgi:hypothetical protein